MFLIFFCSGATYSLPRCWPPNYTKTVGAPNLASFSLCFYPKIDPDEVAPIWGERLTMHWQGLGIGASNKIPLPPLAGAMDVELHSMKGLTLMDLAGMGIARENCESRPFLPPYRADSSASRRPTRDTNDNLNERTFIG